VTSTAGSDEVTDVVASSVQAAYREEWARVLAATARSCGDLDLAEECVQDAFVAALHVWPQKGVPDNPAAWLTTTAKRKAVDQLRRASTLQGKLPLLVEPESSTMDAQGQEESVIADDRLRLVFTCCHPAIAPETQAALTLRLVCGVPTNDIARLFLVSESTMAARLTRGKRKIQVARIPFAMPQASDLDERLGAVLTVIHLFFTAGHTATTGSQLADREVTMRAMALGRLLHELMPGQREVDGLLAVILLTDARRDARVDGRGNLVLLEDQDRLHWDLGEVAEGRALAEAALTGPEPHGRFALQAAIAAVHCGPRAEDTDWSLVVRLYDHLLEVWPSPVVALNRAVAVAMTDGPDAGLVAVSEIEADPSLTRYHYLPAVKADLLRRTGQREAAAEQYRQALARVQNDVERRFLQGRLTEVTAVRRST
jgi:RNA polymerase sigma-70 factor (ECF subfamily)